MLNVRQIDREVNTDQRLTVCVDVSRDWLDGFALHTHGARGGASTIDVRCRNTMETIEQQPSELYEYAQETGLEGLCVVCEPTGGFERKLLRSARHLGHQTAYVNSEHVARLSVVESGDTGKTDPSDARVISLVAQLNRTQKNRVLKGEYLLLRQLGKDYDDEERLCVQARCRIIKVIRELFCDYGKNTEFIFLSTGCALMEEYRWNPHKIVEDGFDRFRSRIKAHVKQVREKTIGELWTQAKSSARQLMPRAYQQVLEQRIERLWSDWTRHQSRKNRLDEDIARIYERLERTDHVPAPFERINRGLLGRFFGETGPLEDFTRWRQLLAYAGLNIRERKSGVYCGEDKITKKGRGRLRKVLGRMAFALIGSTELYGTYYERKLEEGMKAIEARVAVMRKVAKLIFGLHQTEKPYDRRRVFACESQHAIVS